MWAPAHGPQFPCVQIGGGGLDSIDQVLFTVSRCSNSSLFNLEFRIPVFFPKDPRGAEAS